MAKMAAPLLAALWITASCGFAATPVREAAGKNRETERAVFVTGSLIPQRIKLHAIGTNTVAPLRIIGRTEIDRSGRRTTSGVFANEPSIRIIGR